MPVLGVLTDAILGQSFQIFNKYAQEFKKILALTEAYFPPRFIIIRDDDD